MSPAFAPLRPAPAGSVFMPAFAAPAEPPPAEPGAPPVEDDGSTLAAMLEEARAGGYAAGLESGRRATEALGQERIAMGLDMLAAALEQARTAAEDAAQGAASDMAALTLAMLDAALPGMAARRAPELLQGLVASLLPRLRLLRAPRMLVAPALAETIAPVVQPLGVTIAADPAMAEGDARIEWDSGLLHFDRAARMVAVRDAMAQAGIGLEG